jgi:hypothetical protein
VVFTFLAYHQLVIYLHFHLLYSGKKKYYFLFATHILSQCSYFVLHPGSGFTSHSFSNFFIPQYCYCRNIISSLVTFFSFIVCIRVFLFHTTYTSCISQAWTQAHRQAKQCQLPSEHLGPEGSGMHSRTCISSLWFTS